MRLPLPLLALVLLAACAGRQSCTQVGGDNGMSSAGGGVGGGGFSAASGAGYVVRYERTYANGAVVGSLPTCTAATGCEMQCTAVSTTWTCVDEAGATIAVTQGTGGVAYSDPFGRTSLDEITDARAPRLTSAFDAVLASAHTIVMTGYLSTRASTTSTMLHILANTSGSNVTVRNEGSSWKELAGTYTANMGSGTGALGGWGMFAVKSNTAQTTWTIYDGFSSASTTSGAWTDPVGTIWRFGRSSGAGLAMQGPLQSVTVYSVEKTDAEVAALQDAWSGLAVDADNPITLTRNGTRYVIVNGRAVPFGYGVPVVTTRGLDMDTGLAGNDPPGSGWATDATDASSWTAIGTPTTTVNQAAGPFAAWKVGIDAVGEADLIVDDNLPAAVSEGYSGVLGAGDSQTAIGDYTCACWVRSGTSGVTTTEVTIGVVTDGTGSVDCPFTDLTSTFVRKTCTADVGGSPTSIKGRILVGNAAADTGSIIVSQCQCENHAHANGEIPNNDSTPEDKYSIAATEAQTWPTGYTHGGDVEVVFTPDFNHPGQSADYLMVIDGQNAANLEHWIFIAFQYVTKTTPLKMRVALRPDATVPQIGDQTDTDTYSDVISDLVAGTQYVARFRYEKTADSGGYARVNHYLYLDTCVTASTCHATTLIGSDVTGTKLASTDINRGIVYFGRRYNGMREFDGAIGRLTVKELH